MFFLVTCITVAIRSHTVWLQIFVVQNFRNFHNCMVTTKIIFTKIFVLLIDISGIFSVLDARDEFSVKYASCSTIPTQILFSTAIITYVAMGRDLARDLREHCGRSDRFTQQYRRTIALTHVINKPYFERMLFLAAVHVNASLEALHLFNDTQSMVTW